MKQQRNTRQRQMILDAVRARCDHPTADQIYLDVRRVDSKISRGTVYRNLNVLVQQGELCQVKIPHADRFELKQERHYHLYCTRCGTVRDAPFYYQDTQDERAARQAGFTVEGHYTVFEGCCCDCSDR